MRVLTTGGYTRGVAVEAAPCRYEMIFGRSAFFGYATAPDGDVWWFANVPRADEPSRNGTGMAEPERRSSLLELLARDVPRWLPFVGLGVVTAAIAYTAGIAAGRRLGSRLASFVALLEVVAAVVFAWLLLDQLPGTLQLVGGALIVAGVVVVRLGERPPRPLRAEAADAAARPAHAPGLPVAP